MSYRGEDLDLRTPQMGAGEISRARPGFATRSETIWVDETLLACCNLAFDLAVTHRAGEVRLEHLIYALTHIDSAAEILEGRGVKVAALRREMGGIVASEIPIGIGNGKGTPRRSEELEAALREASDLGHRRNAPAGIDELVNVLVDSSRDLPGLVYLRRHLARAPIDYTPARRGDPIRPYVPTYEPRTSWSEPAPTSANRTDAMQTSRIEALELAVRSLGNDLASERKAMSTVLHDIQRDVGSRRDDDTRFGGGMIDRLASIEHAVEKRLADLSRIWSHSNERMQMLESALLKVRNDGGGGMELVALHDRLTGIERALQSLPGDGGRQMSTISDRLAALERGMQTAASDAARHWTVVNDRLKSLDAGLPASAASDFPRFADRIETIEQVVLERASEASSEAARLAERLKVIEDGQAAQKVQALQLNAALAAEVNKLTAALARQPAPGSDRSLALIDERFQAMAAMIERQRGELAGTLAQPVGERLSAIGTALETRQVESNRAVATMAERVAAIERGLTGYMQKVSEMSTGYDEDVGHIQEALLKINGQQAAMSTSLEQWRQQSGELGIMANRLAAIERLSMRPVQMVEQLSEKVDAVYRLTAERIEKRNAFYYWLFGTSNWRAASWPDKKRVLQASVAQPPPPPHQPPVVR